MVINLDTIAKKKLQLSKSAKQHAYQRGVEKRLSRDKIKRLEQQVKSKDKSLSAVRREKNQVVCQGR